TRARACRTSSKLASSMVTIVNLPDRLSGCWQRASPLSGLVVIPSSRPVLDHRILPQSRPQQAGFSCTDGYIQEVDSVGSCGKSLGTASPRSRAGATVVGNGVAGRSGSM